MPYKSQSTGIDELREAIESSPEINLYLAGMQAEAEDLAQYILLKFPDAEQRRTVVNQATLLLNAIPEERVS